jgi:hypothetical protein
MSVMGGFPDRARVRLGWSLSTTVATVSTTQRIEFSINDPFDPNFTTGTTQPANWDIYAAMYDYYRCYGAKLATRITIADQTATSSTVVGTALITSPGMRVAIAPFNNTQTESLSNMWSNPRSFLSSVTAAKPLSYSHAYSSAAVQGLSKLQYTTAERVSALVNTDPVSRSFIALAFMATDNATIMPSVTVDVQLVYDIEFFERVGVNVDLAARMLRNKDAFDAIKKSRYTGRTLAGPQFPMVYLKPSLASGFETGFVQKDISVKAVDTQIPRVGNGQSTSVFDSKSEYKPSGSTTEFKVPKASQRMKLVIDDDDRSWDHDSVDDEDEQEFLAYLKTKFKARAAVRQAHAFENCDFSGSGRGAAPAESKQ